MTSSNPSTLEEYIVKSKSPGYWASTRGQPRFDEEVRRLRADAERQAREWSREFSTGPPRAPLYTHHEQVGSMRDPEYYYREFLSAMSSGKVLQEKDHMAVNRDNYDVSPLFDEVIDTLNSAIQNIGNDISIHDVSDVTESGLNAVHEAFESLIGARNQFYRSESSFAKAKPEPVAELTPDEDGIVRSKYGDVIGRVNLPSRGE